MKYELYFFKENTRKYDAEELIEFLLEDKNMKYEVNEDTVSLFYKNDLVKLEYSLNFTKSSKVPDIARLNPMYLDLDFYIEFDVLFSTFKLNLIISLVEKICRRFGFSIYHVWFEDVTPFRKDIIVSSYDKVRMTYKEQFPLEYQPLNYVHKEKLDAYYSYILDAKATNAYYDNKYLFLPIYFGRNLTFNQINLITELNLETSTIIPPYVDIIVIEMNGVKEYYQFIEVLSVISKFTKEFPGFIGNTKMIEEKNAKKIRKLLSKMKVKPITDRIEKIQEESLVDF